MNPLSQVEVEGEIQRLCALCERATSEVRKRGEYAAQARSTYKIEYAKARLKAEATTVGERDDLATVATAALLTEREFTEALFESAKEAGRNYRAELEGMRSINANLRPLVSP